MSYRKVYEDLAARNMAHVRAGTVGEQFHYKNPPPGVWHIPTALYTYPLAAKMLKGLGYEEFNQACDIGCGTVKFSDYFRISNNCLFEIAWPYCLYMKAVQADIEAMPVPDNFADLVVCSDILEHVQNYEQAMSEVRRVMRTGGILLASVPNDAPINATHLRRFTTKSIFEGFDILDKQLTPEHKGWLQELVIVMRKQ